MKADRKHDRARQPGLVRVWDPVVRLFHWALVTSFVIAWFTPGAFEAVHIWAGYAAAGLVLLRVIWGIAGARHARFANFVKHPSTVFAYLRAVARGTEARHIGHNPAGGAMILALLASMAAATYTGWLMFTDRWYGSDLMVTLHELAANLLLGLVLLHLGGVALASFRHRENLVLAMFTGRKRGPEPGDVD